MKLSAAYDALQLQPYDAFIEGEGPQVGSTTMMLVAGTLFLRAGLPVTLVMRNARHGQQGRDQILTYVEQLNTAPDQSVVRHIPNQGKKSIRFTSGGSLIIESERGYRPNGTGEQIVLRDVDWEESVRMRAKEPLDRARFLLRVEEGWGVGFHVFDALWDFLFEVTEEGAQTLLDNDVMTSRIEALPELAQPFRSLW